jgi:isopenicillin-N N-acyltransferase like protein
MIPVLVLEGSATERGLAYGESARALVTEAAERWGAAAGADRDRVLEALVRSSGFRAAVQRFTPSLGDEIEGIARASDIDRDVIWALNLLDEDWWVRRALGPSTGCSALAQVGDGDRPTLLAQNMDLPARLDGLQVLLDIRPDDGTPRTFAPAYAGIIATNALNEQGIGVCVNTLSTLPTSRDGLPVACFVRHIAAQRTVRDAIRVVEGLPHASGQNYLIGGPAEIADRECGAGCVIPSDAEAGRIVHTNHPRMGEAPAEGGVVANSGSRLRALHRAMEGCRFVDRRAAQAILREPPVCRPRHGTDAFTFYSVVMELSRRPALSLSEGPPDRSDYSTYTFGAGSR